MIVGECECMHSSLEAWSRAAHYRWLLETEATAG
jgi:hypothetical protein